MLRKLPPGLECLQPLVKTLLHENDSMRMESAVAYIKALRKGRRVVPCDWELESDICAPMPVKQHAYVDHSDGFYGITMARRQRRERPQQRSPAAGWPWDGDGVWDAMDPRLRLCR